MDLDDDLLLGKTNLYIVIIRTVKMYLKKNWTAEKTAQVICVNRWWKRGGC